MSSTKQAPAFANANKCFACSATFGMLKRKHHCRGCGRTCCDSCSKGVARLPRFGFHEPVRVCHPCKQRADAGGFEASAAESSASSSTAAAAATSATAAAAPTPAEPAAVAKPKVVSNCTCNMPLCICPADEEEAEEEEEAIVEVKAAPVKKAVKKTPMKSNMFMTSQRQAKVYDLTQRLDDQCREAVKNGDVGGVTQLLEAGADANFIDHTDNSLLHLAAMFNSYPICQLLVARGAKLDRPNHQNETPLDLAPPALSFKLKKLTQ
jgi:hypothetical protein